jgi:hypothetical protein
MADRAPSAIVGHAADKYGVNRAQAAEWTERFVDGRNRDRSRPNRSPASAAPARPSPQNRETPTMKNSSRDDARYESIRENIAQDIRHRIVQPTRAAIVAGIVAGARVSPVTAREFADRFLADLARGGQSNP